MPTQSLNPAVLDRSRPVLRRPLDLATHLGLKTFNRTFGRVEAAVFLAEVVAHLQGAASRERAGEIDQVNGVIAGEFDRLAAFVEGESRHLSKAAPARRPADPPDADVGYTRPTAVVLTMRTPRMRRYADLIASLEGIARALDRAWFAGAIQTPARLELENVLFRNFMRTCGVVQRLAWGLGRRVRDGGDHPDYRAMMAKRTGRDPGPATAPAVAEEGREEMTPEERDGVRATEALAQELLAATAEEAATAEDALSELLSAAPGEGAAMGAADGVAEPATAVTETGRHDSGDGSAAEGSGPAIEPEAALAGAATGDTGAREPETDGESGGADARESAPERPHDGAEGLDAETPPEPAKPRRRTVRDLVGDGVTL